MLPPIYAYAVFSGFHFGRNVAKQTGIIPAAPDYDNPLLWYTQDGDYIQKMERLSMADVCKAFDHFQKHRDKTRPLIIAGFSQGGLAVVEILKHIDDETYGQLAAATATS